MLCRPLGIAVVLGCASVASANIVAHYTFDETSGATAADSVGGVNGTLSGTASFVGGGVAGNALNITGNAGLVNMGDHFAFTSGDFTVSFWVKTTATANDTIALGRHAAFSENGWLFPINPTGGGGVANKANFTASSFVSNGVTSTSSVNDNAWHQIVGVYRAGGTHSIYVDGAPAEETKASEAIEANTAAFLVGGVYVSGVATGRYTGLIDDLQIYDTALSDTAINVIYNTPGSIAPEPATLTVVTLSTLALRRRRRIG